MYISEDYNINHSKQHQRERQKYKCLWNYALLWLRSVEVHAVGWSWRWVPNERFTDDSSRRVSFFFLIKCRAIFHKLLFQKTHLRQEIWSQTAAILKRRKDSRRSEQKTKNRRQRVFTKSMIFINHSFFKSFLFPLPEDENTNNNVF